MRIKKESLKKVRAAIQQMNFDTEYGDLSSGSKQKMEEGEKINGGFVVEDQGKVLGWGVAWDDDEFHLYVSPQHRKRGIGTKIISRAQKHFPEHQFCPWNNKLTQMFKKCGVKIHKNWK